MKLTATCNGFGLLMVNHPISDQIAKEARP
jgi:hypothetical protein